MSGSPTCISVTSWQQLAKLIDDVESVDETLVLFRGVTSSDHKLVPKIGRPGARKDPRNGDPLPHSEDVERRALEMFKRTARPYVSREPQSEFEWLAIAQHFGAPTRLLDWTESPLVAAYFALEKAGTTGTPAIYVLRAPPLVPEAKAKSPFDIPDVLTYLPPHITPRIQVQRRVFTVHPYPSTEYTPPGLTVWHFKDAPHFELKRVVDRCGFNRASLYPDLQGLAEYVGWSYKWGRVFDHLAPKGP